MFGAEVITLKEWLQYRAAGQSQPALKFRALALRLLQVSLLLDAKITQIGAYINTVTLIGVTSANSISVASAVMKAILSATAVMIPIAAAMMVAIVTGIDSISIVIIIAAVLSMLSSICLPALLQLTSPCLPSANIGTNVG